jgi:hypothetical protein
MVRAGPVPASRQHKAGAAALGRAAFVVHRRAHRVAYLPARRHDGATPRPLQRAFGKLRPEKALRTLIADAAGRGPPPARAGISPEPAPASGYAGNR